MNNLQSNNIINVDQSSNENSMNYEVFKIIIYILKISEENMNSFVIAHIVNFFMFSQGMV